MFCVVIKLMSFDHTVAVVADNIPVAGCPSIRHNNESGGVSDEIAHSPNYLHLLNCT